MKNNLLPKAKPGRRIPVKSLARLLMACGLVGLLVYIGMMANEGFVDLWWVDALG